MLLHALDKLHDLADRGAFVVQGETGIARLLVEGQRLDDMVLLLEIGEDGCGNKVGNAIPGPVIAERFEDPKPYVDAILLDIPFGLGQCNVGGTATHVNNEQAQVLGAFHVAQQTADQAGLAEVLAIGSKRIILEEHLPERESRDGGRLAADQLNPEIAFGLLIEHEERAGRILDYLGEQGLVLLAQVSG